MANYYEDKSMESPITRRKKMMADSKAPETPVDNVSEPLVPEDKAKKFVKGFEGVK